MSLFPKEYLDALVSIEVDGKDGEKKPIASSFLFGAKINLLDSNGNQRYLLFLVTNRHVFEDDEGGLIDSVHLRFNTEKEAKYYSVKLLDDGNKPLWLKHKNSSVDLAILQLKAPFLYKDKISHFHFHDDKFIFCSKDFDDVGLSSGHGVFVLGFPRGIRGNIKNRVIVRQGIIARVDEEVLNNNFFYIDAVAYPGNSGGPVISRPETTSITGTRSSKESRLIGVISSGETYEDIAISQQTKKPKIVFEENMGLIRVVPVDKILEIIQPIIDKANDDLEKNKTSKETDKEKTKK